MRPGAWRALLAAGAAGLSVVLGGAFAVAQSDGPLTYAGVAEPGGTISVTLTADRTAVVAFVFDNVPLPRGNCGTGRSGIAASFDPPVLVEDGEFTLQMGGLGTVHNALGYVATGRIESEGRISGMLRITGSIQCEDGEFVPWTAEGPVAAPEAVPSVYLDAGSDYAVRLTASGDPLAIDALELEDVSFLPCSSVEDDVDARSAFDPPLSIDEATGAFSAEMHAFGTPAGTISLAVSGRVVSAERIELDVTGSQFPPCSSERSFVLTRVSGPEPTPVGPGALPSTGAGPAERSLSLAGAVFTACALLIAAGGSLAFAWARRRR